MPSNPRSDAWPALPYDAWQDTCARLRLWTQIVGKIRLARTPWLNHSWDAGRRDRAALECAPGVPGTPRPL